MWGGAPAIEAQGLPSVYGAPPQYFTTGGLDSAEWRSATPRVGYPYTEDRVPLHRGQGTPDTECCVTPIHQHPGTCYTESRVHATPRPGYLPHREWSTALPTPTAEYYTAVNLLGHLRAKVRLHHSWTSSTPSDDLSDCRDIC